MKKLICNILQIISPLKIEMSVILIVVLLTWHLVTGFRHLDRPIIRHKKNLRMLTG